VPGLQDQHRAPVIESDEKADVRFFVVTRRGNLRTHFPSRVQISADALSDYVKAIEESFGVDAEYGEMVKVYVDEGAQPPPIQIVRTVPHYHVSQAEPRNETGFD
jgi:hypothetical protein